MPDDLTKKGPRDKKRQSKQKHKIDSNNLIFFSIVPFPFISLILSKIK